MDDQAKPDEGGMPVIRATAGTAPITPEMVQDAFDEDYVHAWAEWSTATGEQNLWDSASRDGID